MALHRVGWRATVLERAPVLGEIGAGMSQAPNAMRALDALGVGEQARSVEVSRYAAGNLRTPDGRYLQRPGVRTGAEVTGLRQEADRVAVGFGDGEVTADLVVAADCIRSTVRRLLWPDAPPPRFLGRTAWLGVAEVTGLPGSITLGPGGYFLIHPIGRGRAYWAYITTAGRPNVRYDQEKTELVRRVGTWHDPIPRLIGATPTEAVIRIDIHDLDPLPSYVTGRVALLGDAAHAMSPDRGQGAGQSIEDAVVLAAALAGESTVDAALRRYDADRTTVTTQASDLQPCARNDRDDVRCHHRHRVVTGQACSTPPNGNGNGSTQGIDANKKKIKGRKRHIATDVLGLLLAAVVIAASIQDSTAGTARPGPPRPRASSVSLGWVDDGYNDEGVRHRARRGVRVEVVKRIAAQGFHVLA